MPAAGGKEAVVLDSLPRSLWGGWGLAGDSVVYLRLNEDRETPAQIEILSPDTGKTRVAGAVRLRPVQFDGALGVSPDGKHALVSEVERAGSEIHPRSER